MLEIYGRVCMRNSRSGHVVAGDNISSGKIIEVTGDEQYIDIFKCNFGTNENFQKKFRIESESSPGRIAAQIII